MNRLFFGVLVLTFLVLATLHSGRFLSAQGVAGLGPSEAPRDGSTATFSLDGVQLKLTTSFLYDLSLVAADPTSAIQVATAVERDPLLRQFSVTAVPFGASPPTESLPRAGPGKEESYRAALKQYRETQGGLTWDGAVMHLFGEDVIGSTTVVTLRVRGGEAVPVAITEWVVQAGPRLWIVRASQELLGGSISRHSATSRTLSVSDSALSSPDLTAPSTSLVSRQPQGLLPGDASGVTSAALDLDFPAWWVGDCDTVNFHAATGVAAYPLGAEYRGMKACGPRPFADGGPWRWVNFGAGNSQIEWQCPELSKRFLYLAYGIPPYSANGNQMVSNYEGDLLEKVWNCTTGHAPQADDVLSYGSTSTYGHTSVVVASDVDAAGNGTVDVIEQNSSSDGNSRLYVDNWCLTSYTDIIGWLHNPGWFVTYYGDDSLIDQCGGDGQAGIYLFEAWGDGAPAPGCPSDQVSARFSRTIEFPGGDYTFALGYDEGARLKVDGETVVDGWGAADQHYATHHLEEGYHRVSVESYDRFGDAALTAFWWGPGFDLSRETRDASRWYAEHWGNPELWWEPVVTAVEGAGPLDHQWSWDSPADILPVDHFSSRFRRVVSFDAGRWQFDLFADDGVRFWVDDLLVVDEWQPQRAWFRPTVTIGGGNHELIVEHYENEEVADIGLDWARVSEAVTPTGWVTSPTDGTVINSCPVTIAAHVGDDIGPVNRVEFHAFYDGSWQRVGSDDGSPYRCVWDCLRVGNQMAWLTVHVWDDAGREFVDLDNRVRVRLDHLEDIYLPLIIRRDPGES